MPRRYAPDGRPLINGKLPEDLTESEMRQFLADSKKQLNRKDYKDMATNTATKTATEVTAPADTETQAPAEAGIQIGETSIEVDVRPIEPKGKLIGFATVTIGALGGNVTIPDFKIFNGDSGLFVSNPSTRDESTRSGFRDTARVNGNDLKNLINVAVRDAYVDKVQQLQARAAAAVAIDLQQPRIKDQLAKAGQEAAKDNAARTAPQKNTPARDDR